MKEKVMNISINHIFAGLDVMQSVGYVSTNTRPHQLRWGDLDMGTAVSCVMCN